MKQRKTDKNLHLFLEICSCYLGVMFAALHIVCDEALRKETWRR